ncbi:MAG TPA: hypothetical protein VF212_18095 [Longimicrobiales bacterium]
MAGQHEDARVPFRRVWRARRRDAGEKLRVKGSEVAASVVPMRVRVEVYGGRNSTASTMRAYRVMQEIEGTGGVASIIELTPDGSALVAELDGAQASRLARLPFVRRIVSVN